MSRPDWAPAFEAYATRLLEPYNCPGLSVGVARGGEPIYFHGFGYRDREQQLPLTPDTIHGIASCTKSFICVAIMQLQEAGRLSVYDPVVKYLPEFQVKDAAAGRAITLHHLMTHTAGLPPLPTLFHALLPSMKPELPPGVDWDAFEEIHTYEQMMAFLACNPIELLGPPGTRFSYSNDGFALLGCVVERVSGQSIEAYVQEHILQPAGMTRTLFDTARLESLENVTVLYDTEPSKDQPGAEVVVPAPRWWEQGPMTAAGALRSTVNDMLRYAEIYRTGGEVHGVRLLARESVEAMMTPHVDMGNGQAYGYGLQVMPSYHGVSLVEHGGALKGIAANFTIVPGRELTGVVLSNLQGTPSAQILLGALNAAMGIPVESRRIERRTYHCPAEVLKQYEGTYPQTEGLSGLTTFWVDGDVLKVKTEGGSAAQPEAALVPVAPHEFELRSKETTTILRFRFNAHGEVEAVQFGLRLVRRGAAAPAGTKVVAG